LRDILIGIYPASQESAPGVPPSPTIPSLSDEARKLLIAVADDPKGILLRIRTRDGWAVQTNDRNFNADGDARSEARWERAIEELEEHELIKDRGSKQQAFAITDEGYRIADLLRSSLEKVSQD
jgi:hypothetical protein